MEVEGDGSWVLYGLNKPIGADGIPDEIDISFGVCYCHHTEDQSVIFTLCNKAWTSLSDHFLKKKDSSGKWVDDPEKAKTYEEVKELTKENKGRSIIYAAGHAGLETIIKHYSGKWVILDGMLLTKDTTKVSTLLVGIDSDSVDEELVPQVTTGNIQPLQEYSDVPKAGLMGKPLPVLVHPETKEVLQKETLKEENILGIPLAVDKLSLPVVRYSGGNRGKSAQEKYDENLAVILNATNCKDYTELRRLSIEDPMTVRLAFATMGSGYALSPGEFEAALKSEVNVITQEAKVKESDD